MFLSAQEHSTTVVFRNNQTGEQHKINPGDYVKLRVLEGTMNERYSGTFKAVSDGMLLLKGQRSIPIANIEGIAYKPKVARWLFWGLLFVGAMLGGIGFLLVFAEYSSAVAVARVALFLVVLGTVISLGSVKRIKHVNTNWSYEYQSPTTTSSQKIPQP